jgi:hypothetical protein
MSHAYIIKMKMKKKHLLELHVKNRLRHESHIARHLIQKTEPFIQDCSHQVWFVQDWPSLTGHLNLLT